MGRPESLECFTAGEIKKPLASGSGIPLGPGGGHRIRRRSLGSGGTFFSLLDVQRVGAYDLSLQGSHGFFCIFIPLHLYDTLAPAKAGYRIDEDLCIIHPTVGVK